MVTVSKPPDSPNDSPSVPPPLAPLLEVRELRTYFRTSQGIARAVDGVSFSIHESRTLGVVGESGCGKSVTAMSCLRLVPEPPGDIVGGQVLFQGRDLLQLAAADLRRVRGNRIAVIFQEPMTSLNPVFRAGDQVAESLRLHRGVSRKEAHAVVVATFKKVGISDPELRARQYPHQMSGGMKQRVMIAMALVCNPALLIADEPTTALDVTIQAQILQLLRQLQRTERMAMLLITHDLGVIAEMADDVVVMYAGKIVESASVVDLFTNPQHPYTLGLFRSLPRMGRRKTALRTIEGVVPNPLDAPGGCKFRARCEFATEICASEEPVLRPTGMSNHRAACHHLGTFKVESFLPARLGIAER
ncbi:MAG: ABC transporter ATP-binding protein [Planctomycetota bacterium]